MIEKKNSDSNSKDFLWSNLLVLPYFRALLRAVEADFYQEFVLESPILDLGCGDGLFAKITFEQNLDVGMDPGTGFTQDADKLGIYDIVVQGSGEKIPYPKGYFMSVISNSVLEHISNLDAVLLDLARVMKPGGLFLFCVPNHNFLPNLSISSLFDQLKLKILAERYRVFFNKISRHIHCDPPDIWEKRLQAAGFTVERHWNYFSPTALGVLEWGHYFGLPSLVAYWIFGRWILVPKRWNLWLTRKLIERYFIEHTLHPKGSYSFYVTRRRQN